MNLYFWILQRLLTIENSSGYGASGSRKGIYPFTVGGGIRTVEDFRLLLREGADKISINSSAIDNPQLIHDAAQKFGRQCVVVAVDAKRRADGSGWNVYKHGGRLDTGLDVLEWVKKQTL